jgi:O-antigen/teichoic acid export membrane protein
VLTALSKLSGVSRKSLFEAIFTIGGRMLSVFLVIATTKFLTTFLSEADYGQLALYNITATLPSTFFFGPVGQGILRFYPIAKEKQQLGAFHRAYNTLHSYGAKAALAAGFFAALTCWFTGQLPPY